MQTLARLFGQSPFAPLHAHLELVAECVRLLPSIFQKIKEKQYEEVEALSKEISKKEFEADNIKNELRNHIPVGLFMPISRAGILEIISIQDTIADVAEDIGILLTVKNMCFHNEVESIFFSFLAKNIDAFELTFTLLHEFNHLLESSFGGRKADKARKLVAKIAETEHQADVIQRSLMKIFFSDDINISEKDLYLWLQLIKTVSKISDHSEKLAHRINMTLEEK